jgi:hypothetical protein
VNGLGWPGFFCVTSAMAIPGLALAYTVTRPIAGPPPS